MQWKKVNIFWNDHPLVASVIIFILFFAASSLMLSFSSGDPLMDDHYFHFKYAYLVRTEGLSVVTNFDWICPEAGECPQSRYAISLFQLSLIPFTYITDWLFALHLVDAFYASAALSLIYYVLRKQKVKYALFFMLILFSSSYFITRLLWGRAFIMIIGLVFLEMQLAIDKKYRALFVVSVIHILWHQSSYFMPLGIIGFVEMARYLVEQKFFIKNILSTIVAIIVGMAFFPGYPQSIISWFTGLFSMQQNAQLDEGGGGRALGGYEMLSKDFMSYFAGEKTLLFFFIFCVASVLFLYIGQKTGHISIINEKIQKNIIWIYTLFIFSLGTMYATITMSGRIFDFFIPALFVLTAFLVSFFSSRKEVVIDPILKKFFVTSIVIYFCILFVNTSIEVYAFANKFDYAPVGKVAQWIEDNSEDREKVFLYNWSHFTLLFFTNSNNIYTSGIEPSSMKARDEILYWKYYNIFRYNYYCEELGDCKEEYDQLNDMMTKLSSEEKEHVRKNIGKKIINSVKNEFGATFIVSDSNVLSSMIYLNPELIEDSFYIKSDKFKGPSMEFTVFKLKQ